MPNPLSALKTTTLPWSTKTDTCPDWSSWLERLFGVLGCALVLSGAIYFFAFNWAELSKWTKFALIEGALAVCLAGVWRCGLSGQMSGLFVCAASVLVGVFLAVFGQTYQTGANAWQLFAAWAGFIALWTLVTRHAAQWALLLILLNVTIWLYAVSPHDLLGPVASWKLLALNLATLALREAALKHGQDWLRSTWTGIVPLLLLLTTTTLTICQAAIFHDGIESLTLLNENTVAFLGALCLAGLTTYFHHSLDARRLALTLICGFPILNVLFCTQLVPFRRWDTGPFFVLGLFNIGYAVAATTWLRRVHHARQKQEPLQDSANPQTHEKPRAAGMPVAIMVVHSIGGILGAALFALVCGLTLNGQSALIGTGLLLIAGSVLLFRFLQGQGHDQERTGSAGLSFCFSLVLLGLGLYGVGAEDNWGFWLMFTGISALLVLIYILFSHPLMRFASAAIWVSLLFMHCLITRWDMANGTQQAIMLGLAAACVTPLVLTALRLHPPRPLVPAAWAGICLLISGILCFVVVRSLGGAALQELRMLPHAFLLYSLAATLLVLLLVELRSAEGDRSARTVAHATTGALVLAGLVWLDALGILLGLNLLMLGYGRRTPQLTILGAIFLPLFLVSFYYDLNTTLLVKSVIVSGSGAMLLLGIAYLRLTRQEVQPCA